MADSTVTVTGLAELQRVVRDLPDHVKQALQGTARATAVAIHDHARTNLVSQQKTSSRKLADNIRIEERPEEKVISVVSYPPPGQPAHVTIWNEHGTVRMEARPYMRPAAESARGPYTQACEEALARVLSPLT